MAPTEALIPGAIAILFVVAWFIAGLIDATCGDRSAQPTSRAVHPARAATHHQERSR
ncbi:hypothetical protein GCM10009740_20620 [Terrabacter terrae]|uniref:Uncharacterized protein n=1 Tax=Terrabacter terrae TaxID=318434 RepID=A0ABN2U6W5_9MICO